MCQSCRTCNCAVSRWRSLTVLLNSARSLSAGSGCGDNLFTISRTFSYGVSWRWSRRSVMHRLYAIKAGMERSIVVILSRRSLWRPIKSHRRSSISDATFAKGESRALPTKEMKCQFYLMNNQLKSSAIIYSLPLFLSCFVLFILLMNQ